VMKFREASTVEPRRNEGRKGTGKISSLSRYNEVLLYRGFSPHILLLLGRRMSLVICRFNKSRFYCISLSEIGFRCTLQKTNCTCPNVRMESFFGYHGCFNDNILLTIIHRNGGKNPSLSPILR